MSVDHFELNGLVFDSRSSITVNERMRCGVDVDVALTLGTLMSNEDVTVDVDGLFTVTRVPGSCRGR